MKSILGLITVAGLVFACENSPRPDQVVGVLVRCEAGTLEYPAQMNGDECDVPNRRNVRKVITVRTHDGRTYTAEVSVQTSVTIGQTWP